MNEVMRIMSDMQVDPKTDYTIRKLVDLWKGDILRVNPEYQRGEKWNRFQQQFFIDSVLRGYPVPAFYFHDKKTEKHGRRQEFLYIVDGQQRINAVRAFINGDFELLDPKRDEELRFPNFVKDDECPWAGKRFDDLDKELKKQFLDEEVIVYEITAENENRIRDLFIRLQGGVPLNAQEKRDSWPGDFTEFVLIAGGKTGMDKWYGWPFFKEMMRVPDETRRRQLVAMCYMLFHTNRHEQRVVDAKSKNVDDFYRKNIDFDKRGEDAIRFKTICDKLANIFKGHPTRLPAHHTIHLILFMDEVMDMAVDLRGIPQGLTDFALNCDNARKAFEEKRESPDKEYNDNYVAYTRAGSDNATSIQRRHVFFVEKMEGLAKIKFKDPERAFDSLHKKVAYYRDNRHCQVCKMKGEKLEVVRFDEAEFHHIVPHVDGGPTTIDNCATVHKDCHPLASEDVEAFKDWWNTTRKKQDQSVRGILPPDGTRLRFASKSHKSTGIIEDQVICLDGHKDTYTSLSAAGKAVTGRASNGWTVWEIRLPDEDDWVLASVWRDHE